MFKPNRKFLLIITFATAVCFVFNVQLHAQISQTVNAGSSTAAENFPKTTCTYNWTNSNPAIGLAASGSGDIASFTATNTTGAPITATITAIPSGTRNQPLLYIPNYNDNTVSVIDASTNALITTVPLSGTHPYNVTVSRDYNRVFISNQGSNDVNIIYMPTNQLYKTITGFSSPGAIAIGPGNLTGYVANTASNTVSIIENFNYTISGTITVGNGPTGLALSLDGNTLYVSNSTDNTISVVNTVTKLVTATIPIDPSPTSILLTTNEDKLYIVHSGSNEISVINTTTHAVGHISVGNTPKGIALNKAGDHLYVTNSGDGTVSVINTTDGSLIATINTGSVPTGVSISDDGSLVYVTNSGNNNVSVISTASNTVTQTDNVGITPYSVGNFYLNRADCAAPVTFTITVNAAAITPAITTTGTPVALNTTYGTPSSLTSFNVLGTNMTAGILVTPPAGFEVSTDGINFSNTVSVGAPGTIAPGTVYIRLKKTTAVGPNYSGTISLTSPGAATVNVSMPQSTITGATLNVTVQNVNKPYGNTLTSGSTTSGFTISGLQNGETIPSITINYGTGAAAADAPGNYPGSAVPSPVLVGTNGFVLSNYIINLINGNIVVLAPAAPSITANSSPSAVNTVYGTASTPTTFTINSSNLTGRIIVTAPTGFEVSADGITYAQAVTFPQSSSNTTAKIYIRLLKSAAAGPHSGNITFSSVGATDLLIAMPLSTVTPKPINILVRGTKVYGTSIPANFTAGPADVDFSPTNQQLVNGELINSIDITFTAGYNATDPAATYSLAIHIANAQGTNGFLPSNYTITYQSGDLTATPAPLNITAADVNKPNGASLSGGPIATGYSVTGLKNGETITGVTVAYGNGAASSATAGTYPASVLLSNATGANGFLASNYTITYVPANIIVGAAGSVITASGSLTPLITVYGTPSTAETFTVAGSNLKGGIVVNPPAGFEISTDGITFGATISIQGINGISNQIVYIRLASSTPVGIYSGDINMHSNNNVFTLPMPASTVTATPLTVVVSNLNKIYGQTLSAGAGFTNFTATGLKNNETINSVTINYASGGSAASKAGVYSASAVASQPVGTGTFLASNYNITYLAGDLTVTQAALTVTADNQTRPYGSPNPTLTFTYSGFVNGEDTTVLTTKPTAATPATLASLVGQYPIAITGGAAQNYSFNYVQGTLTVTAIPGLPVSIPNAFTPNGDGINDIWNIVNLNTYAQSHVQIFNRYGMLVFNSVGYAMPWDGTEKNTRVPDGTYYYVIILTPGDSPLSGSVTVIR